MRDFNRRAFLGAAAAGTAAMAGGGAAFAQSPLNEAKPNLTAKPPVFGPAPGVALLSRNENPYGPSPSAVAAIYDTAAKGCYYADGGLRTLTDMIAERFGLDGDHVAISSGSTEILCAAALSMPQEGAILCPGLFWDTTVDYAARKGAAVKRVPLTADMEVDLPAMLAAIGPDVGMVQICNPNNPTGIAIDGDELRTFIRQVDPRVTILIDEAYNELTDRPEYTSVSDMVAAHPNLIVCRTFSKIYGMAGLRVGYALAAPEKVETMRGYLMSFGGNTAGLSGAIASYNDEPFLDYSRKQILTGRQMILDAVQRAGLTALPSQTNFVYVKVPDADSVQTAMADRGIMIRGAYGAWTTWSRVSTGKLEDVEKYAAALPEVVASA
ncbi:histidinol phosphate aminotransferase [Pacificimonas flava]|uniref:Histidinol phosphate aminotransferase n=2 Tax=Pacificimonas TaxID=1960290 RepID=A0A219B411_9SPHN|nr:MULTISPECIES: histidinol-phosphate transaminase [Pacificimonas]MBZ6377168.1 aminotransferase class I/II-fold pyridoxal phosphate-dependent enzyme [Pacificimonas aurantium]OWV33110.1 histidinol phosphate aminotransferase [Pacificimonas flava]